VDNALGTAGDIRVKPRQKPLYRCGSRQPGLRAILDRDRPTSGQTVDRKAWVQSTV